MIDDEDDNDNDDITIEDDGDDFGFGDDDLDDGSDGFDDFKSSDNTLGKLLRENPIAKFGLILVGGVLLFGLISLISGPKESVSPSLMTAGQEVPTRADGGELTPAMREAIQESNEQRFDEAILTGSSALPTPIDRPTGILDPLGKIEKEDTLERWKRLKK